MPGKRADHITIAAHPGRVRVQFAGQVVAASDSALSLREGSFPPVLYIPRDDADMSCYRQTEHATHCPYKGDASYFSLVMGDRVAENAVWTYEEPFEEVAAIREYLAFYPHRVDSIEEIPG